MQSAGFSAVCHVSVEVGVGKLTTSGVVRVVRIRTWYVFHPVPVDPSNIAVIQFQSLLFSSNWETGPSLKNLLSSPKT